MQSSFAISTGSAARGIIAAQATSDEMLLESIAAGEKACDACALRPPQRSRLSLHPAHRRRHLVAEDLVSQVFLDVWRTAGQFEGRSQVSTWMLAIARFKALTALRNRRHEDIEQEEVLQIADTGDTPETAMDRSQTSSTLRKAIAQLSPAHREIIDLVYYHEKSVEEVGQIIGIPQATVKTRMFYARKHLAELLREAGFERKAA